MKFYLTFDYSYRKTLCCDLRTFVWSENELNIPVEQKGQI